MTISIQKISKQENKIKFLVKEINYSLANALRRTAQEILILAIDTVEFYKNDSALSDEILAHRLGLVPLKTDKSFGEKDKCSCKGKGCIKCSVALKLKAIGPCTVYAKDFKVRGAEIIYKEMPLVILAKDQQLELAAQAILGKGKEHAKFSPGLVFYNSYPIIESKGELPKELIKICPLKAIKEEKGKVKIDPLKCDLCEACVEEYRNKEKTKAKYTLKISPSETDFIFTVESWGQLSPKEILIDSVKTLDKNLNNLSKQINKI